METTQVETEIQINKLYIFKDQLTNFPLQHPHPPSHTKTISLSCGKNKFITLCLQRYGIVAWQSKGCFCHINLSCWHLHNLPLLMQNWNHEITLFVRLFKLRGEGVKYYKLKYKMIVVAFFFFNYNISHNAFIRCLKQHVGLHIFLPKSQTFFHLEE